MAAPNLALVMGLPPERAIEYFRAKGYAVGWDWREVWQQSQARAFTVAGVMKVDALQAIRGTLDKALAEGQTLAEWKKAVRPELERQGLLGRHKLANPATGEVKTFAPHRLGTIYRTNLQTAYMAGRYAQQLENVDARPCWQYVAVLDSRTRPHHRTLHGRTFRYDDPFWASFYPPNGFGCRCRVRALGARDIASEQVALSTSEGRLDQVQVPSGRGANAPKVPVARFETGPRQHVMPDPGWSYNPGQAWLKPFTPPPLDDLPRSFPQGVPLPDLPAPTAVPASRMLAEGLPPADYAAAFLQRFGLQPGQSRVFKDKTGAPLAVSEDLFKAGDGTWKADKDGRGPFMSLLADAVIEPDEIWLRWEPSRDNPGAWLLKRRYLKSWQIDGSTGPQYGVSVFEFGRDGWTGSSAMMANAQRGVDARRRYIEKQRDGHLAWRK